MNSGRVQVVAYDKAGYSKLFVCTTEDNMQSILQWNSKAILNTETEITVICNFLERQRFAVQGRGTKTNRVKVG